MELSTLNRLAVLASLCACCALAGCAPDEDDELASTDQALSSFNVYLGSFHGHSNYSDGDNPPRDVFTWARDRGSFDFYILSDHAELLSNSEWNTSASLADEFNRDGTFVAIRAFEYSNPLNGHANVFNTSGRKAWFLSSNSSFYNWVDANNGIGQFNHAGDHGSFSNYQFVANVSDNFKLMETANGSDTNASGKFIGHYDSALAKGWKLAPTANLDNHSLSDSGVRTGILANSLTRAGVYEAMQVRRVFSSDDLYIELRFSLGDHWMGEEVRSAPGAHTFSVAITSDETIAKIELIVKGASVASVQPGTDTASWSPSIQVRGDTYAYVKVTEADGDVSLSAPIWIDVP
ncbi:MAG TPA: CehA/McbA family metallohydrolase [Polyangiales bacterium]